MTARSQTAVDLMTGPGRDPAEAQELLDWMERNGARAIYLHTGPRRHQSPKPPKDSDLAFDVRRLADQPLIDAAMRAADLKLDTSKNPPGA